MPAGPLPFSGLVVSLRQNVLRLSLARVVALGLCALTCVVYIPYLENALVFDDHNILDFINYAFWFGLAPRWLPYASLAHTHVMMDGSLVAMRVGNLLLHAGNVVLSFVLLRELCAATLQCTDTHRRRAHALIVASCGAAVFAVHPVAVYAVGYLVQRSILMSTFFMFLMLIAYLRWLITGRTALWIWSAVWYLLSVLSKEHSVAAPLVVFMLTWLVLPPSVAALRRLIAPFAVYLAIALLVVSMVKGVLGAAYEPYAVELMREVQDIEGAPTVSYPLSIVTQLYLYFKYLLLWIYPDIRWMSLDMREPMAASLLAWPYIGSLAGVTCYAFAAVAMVVRGRGRRTGLVGWILLYPLIMFATELSTIRVQEPFVLYRSYLWFPVFGALVPLTFIRFNAKLTAWLTLPVLCVLVGLSWDRLESLSTPLRAWSDAEKLLVTRTERGAARIYYNRALALAAENRQQEALSDLDRTLSLTTRHAPVYFFRAQVRYRLKRYAESLEDLNVSIKLDPKRASAYLARSVVLKKLGRTDEALADLRKSCDMKDFMGCYAMSMEVKGR